MPFQRPASADLAVQLFGPSPARTLTLLRGAWPLAVGPELARRTEVVAVEGTTLRVRVPDASWRGVLLKMQGPLLGRLRGIAGGLVPGRLAFCEGPVASPAEAKTPVTPLPPPPASPALLSAAEGIRDADLRASFLTAAVGYMAHSRS